MLQSVTTVLIGVYGELIAVESAQSALTMVALFGQLPENELEELTRQIQQQEFTRGELIFSQGDPGDGLYILTRGRVAISRRGPDGDELILALCEPGDHFGELALFDDEPRSAGAAAVESSRVLFLGRATFRAFLETHPAAVLLCLESIVQQFRRCTDLVDEIALLDVRGRLASRLLKLGEQAPVHSSGSNGHFRITQQQLASMIGTTRESVNKHLGALVDEGIISLDGGRVHILDAAALRKYSAKLS